MVVSWTTAALTPDTTCLFGTHQEKLTQTAVGTAQLHRPAFDRTEYLHTVALSGLSSGSAGTRYHYRCGSTSSGVLSPLSSFRSDVPQGEPLTVAWLGDTGNHPVWTARTVPAIGNLAANGSVDAFIHVGDMAYYSAVVRTETACPPTPRINFKECCPSLKLPTRASHRFV